MTFENALDAVSEWSHSLDKSRPSDEVGTVPRWGLRVLIFGVFVPGVASIVFALIGLKSECEYARAISLFTLAVAYFGMLLYQVAA